MKSPNTDLSVLNKDHHAPVVINGSRGKERSVNHEWSLIKKNSGRAYKSDERLSSGYRS